MNMKEVAITGATFTGNRGAEAMLTTVIGRVHDKDPDVICNVFSYYPEDDRLPPACSLRPLF